MSEKHLPHKPDVLSSIPRSEGRGQGRGLQRSEEKCDLGRSGTEQGMTSASQLSLDVFYRAFHRGPKSTVRSRKEEFAASVCPELQLGHKKGM